ncbi:MAG TPA: alpha/beta hydrolase [Candidatus Limnocylindria bacterium]|nr:alpha/beta hydrolase [Candidatus Limnocylindria bacterium]
MKTVFVINGMNIHHTAADEPFEVLRNAIAAKGYRVVPIDVSWRRKTPSQFAGELLEFYLKQKGDYNIVLGNSFGAVVALITAAQARPDEIILCSLSPFFAEDTAKEWPTKRHLGRLGKRRLEDISRYSVAQLAASVKRLPIKKIVMYGEQEVEKLPKLVARAHDTAKALDAKLVEVPGAPHSFKDQAYVKGIVQEL